LLRHEYPSAEIILQLLASRRNCH